MKLISTFLLLISSFSVSAGVFVKSCTGTIKYCDDLGICTDDYFYLYAYQSTTVINGELRNLRSRLRLRGALGVADDYNQTVEIYEQRVVYTGLDFDLAIPIESGNAILYRAKNSDWQKICD